MKHKLTYRQRKLVMEALTYYRDLATQPESTDCGLKGPKKRIINQAIDKIQRLI